MSNLPILDATSGQALPADKMRIAEIIQDFDSDLELRWIPPRARTQFDTKPWGIFHYKDDHPEGGYFVSFFAEDEMDHRVIAFLFKMRNQTMKDVEALYKAQEVLKYKERMEEMEEADEFRKWAIQSPKTVRHNGVTYGY